MKDRYALENIWLPVLDTFRSFLVPPPTLDLGLAVHAVRQSR